MLLNRNNAPDLPLHVFVPIRNESSVTLRVGISVYWPRDNVALEDDSERYFTSFEGVVDGSDIKRNKVGLIRLTAGGVQGGSMRVDPDGPVPCDLAVVGESPGKEEVEAGRGFVGKSGRILWGEEDLIGSIVGRQRETVWVTNVCKVPCPEDQWQKLPLDEREFWISELLTELNLVKPNLILAFGSKNGYCL